MTPTNKNLDFLSNENLVTILRSLLDEIDLAVNSGAHRSTTYLAVSAIEGLFGEILKLKGILPSRTVIPTSWPTDKRGQPKPVGELTLKEREDVLQAAGALPPSFDKLYGPVRVYRNYMHPERELKERTPIAQSVAQLAVACLNALIEQYGSLRVAAGHEWHVEYGLAQVPADNIIQMPQNPGEFASLLVSERPVGDFREVKFSVIVPPNAIFNLVYSYYSRDRFKAARIEGRVREDGRGLDNGRLICTKWRVWAIDAPYTAQSEPGPSKHEHSVHLVLDPPGSFALYVDGVSLVLERGIGWEFDPAAKLGFMTEWGAISIADLQVTPC